MRVRAFPAALALLALAVQVDAQVTQLAVLAAEDRRALTAADLATIRAGTHSADLQTVRLAVRALGRLERPALIPDILRFLSSPVPELRTEASTAAGQAAQGWKGLRPNAVAGVTLDGAYMTLAARLTVDDQPSVRGAIAETIGRLPYTDEAQVRRAEAALVDASQSDAIDDQLGAARGFEALVRRQRALHPPGPAAVARLRVLAQPSPRLFGPDPARIRRLALEALIAADAADDDVLARAAADTDPQVRRLAMRAAARNLTAARGTAASGVLKKGLTDEAPMVRIEAVRGLRPQPGDAANADACATSLAAVGDGDAQVALVALGQLAPCGASPDAVSMLQRTVDDLSKAGSPRGWHRAAAALVALAGAAPDQATAALVQFSGSRIWQLRVAAARTAAILSDRAALEKLAADDDDNVREAALEGLTKVADHVADTIYIAALERRGYQVIRVAAAALAGTPEPRTALPALKTALQRLKTEGRDNSHDARQALADALKSLGSPADPKLPVRAAAAASPLDASALRRLASPRARIAIRGVGSFELALFTTEAPATVLRFARLAESGYYNGLTFHRVVPNFVIQGGSPGANEYVGDAAFMRDELGSWPHVRGAVGISTRGRDTGDAQIFIDLVDNPSLDHDYTVFAQVLNGIDVVDRILEGDVIERVEILVN